MIHPPEASESDQFHGFDEARMLMWCYEARTRVYERIAQTSFLGDERVAAVHVENTSRADRVYLTAFDHTGLMIGSDTLYVDEPDQRLDVTPEFDHDFTGMVVAEGSELAQGIDREDGWVIDMQVLRDHDPVADRTKTQRRVFLAHMADMIAGGQIQSFIVNHTSTEDEIDKPTESGAT